MNAPTFLIHPITLETGLEKTVARCEAVGREIDEERSGFQHTTTTLTVAGEEFELEVRYLYTPSERRTWGYPGYPASVEVYDATIEGKPFALTTKMMDAISAEILGYQ